MFGLHYEQPGRWAGLRVGAVHANAGYFTMDAQLAAPFIDEPTLAPGNFARLFEIHVGAAGEDIQLVPMLRLGPINAVVGLGLGFVEYGPYEGRGQGEPEDEKSGFGQLELGLLPSFLADTPLQIAAVPYVGAVERPSRVYGGKFGNRYGVDVHARLALPGIVAAYATFGWASWQLGELSQTTGDLGRLTGYSFLIGLTPLFLFPK